jgi:hypothetical protein
VIEPRSSFGGRRKGSKNKIYQDLKYHTKKYTEEALREILRIMRHAEKDSDRLAAATAILDRAWGKPKAGGEEVGREFDATSKPIYQLVFLSNQAQVIGEIPVSVDVQDAELVMQSDTSNGLQGKI